MQEKLRGEELFPFMIPEEAVDVQSTQSGDYQLQDVDLGRISSRPGLVSAEKCSF